MTIASLFASNCSFGFLHSTLHFVQTYRLHLRSPHTHSCTYCMRWSVVMLTRASSDRAADAGGERVATRLAWLKLPRHRAGCIHHGCRNKALIAIVNK